MDVNVALNALVLVAGIVAQGLQEADVIGGHLFTFESAALERHVACITVNMFRAPGKLPA
jgi:hypothetical protein